MLHTGRSRPISTYDFVICTTRVVRPRGLLHHSLSNGFEVEQVVALAQGRHALDPLLALRLLRILRLLLLLDGGHVDLAQVFRRVEVLVEGVAGVDGVELRRRILACILEDDLLATGMLCGMISRRFCATVTGGFVPGRKSVTS